MFGIRWSQDGTQIVAGGGTGALIFAHIIEQEKTSRNLQAKTIGRKVIELHDIVTRTVDSLDFPDRIIKWELGYGHLVVATTNQVHVYNEKYTNTPLSIIDGRSDVRALILAKKYYFDKFMFSFPFYEFLAFHTRQFLILDSTAISIFTYTGRLHLTPKYSGLNAHLSLLSEKTISLGLHYVAVRDCGDESCKSVYSLQFPFNKSNCILRLRSDSCFRLGTRRISAERSDCMPNQNVRSAHCRKPCRNNQRPIFGIHRRKS